jgi:hypothetical protein
MWADQTDKQIERCYEKIHQERQDNLTQLYRIIAERIQDVIGFRSEHVCLIDKWKSEVKAINQNHIIKQERFRKEAEVITKKLQTLALFYSCTISELINRDFGFLPKNSSFESWKELYDELSIFFMNPRASFENLLQNTKQEQRDEAKRIFLTTVVKDKPLAANDKVNITTFEDCYVKYMQAAKLYHPDKNRHDPKAKEHFQTLGNAWDTFKSEIARIEQVTDVDVGSRTYLATLDQ